MQGALIENSQQIVDAVNDRIHRSFGGAAENTSVAAYGSTVDPASGFWLTGYGNWMTTDATFNTAEFRNSLGGVAVGYDHRIGDYGRLGVPGGYSRTSTTFDTRSSEADADTCMIGVYGGADYDHAAVSIGAPIAEDAAVIEAGLDFKAADGVTIGALYEGQYGDGAIANGFNARVLVEF